MVVTKPILLL